MKLRLIFLLSQLGIASLAMAAGDAITFMGTSDNDLVANNSYTRCMEKAMHKLEPHRTLVAGKDFKHALFPYFEPATAPKSVPELTALLTHPAVQQRIETMGVRYVAVILGHSGTSEDSGGILCGISFEFGGCFGFASNEERTDITVALWDLEVPQASAETAGADTGKNVVVGLGIPIPFFTDTKNPACADAARKILAEIRAEG
jgi:hypothetical protein